MGDGRDYGMIVIMVGRKVFVSGSRSSEGGGAHGECVLHEECIQVSAGARV